MAKGLDRRNRDKGGEIRHKSGATRIKSLRKIYGHDFAKGHRSDMKLDTLLEKTGAKSLSDFRKHYD